MDIRNKFYHYLQSIKAPIFFLTLLWLIQIVNSIFFEQGLNEFGIIPRDTSSLSGILFSPFLHHSYHHLFSNSFLLFLFSWIISFQSHKLWYLSIFLITVVGGAIVWIIGGNSVHIGSGILVFGWLGTIIGIASHHKQPFFILATIILVFVYGISLFVGIIPQEEISFASNLAGFVSGFATSKFFNYNKS